MFGSKQRGKVIAKELKIVGNVTAEGLVQVDGQIDGELHCTLLVIARGARVNGTVAAKRVVVDGKVEGPIQGGEVVLKSQAHVVGDVHYQSLAIESGVFLDGRLVQVRGNGQTPEKIKGKSKRQIAKPRKPSRRIERAVEADLGPMRQITNRESLSRRIERAVEADKSEADEPGRVFTEH
jgi:cytoskeletal protein CcmA (bactofilin family)